MPLARLVLLPAVVLGFVAVRSGWTKADEVTPIEVTLKDHRFLPAEIHVPSGRRADLRIHNQDTTAEEFDSSALKVEKVIAAGSSAIIHLRPLGPGRFPFMGELHSATAQGVVVAE